MIANSIKEKGLTQEFEQSSQGKGIAKPKKKAAPFSLRLTLDERAILDQKAGSQPLGSYIRKRLLGDNIQKRRPIRKPKVDEKLIALVLAELGRFRLSSNVNQLAKAYNTGTLGVSDNVGQEFLAASQAIKTMRDTLIAALGLKPRGEQ